MQRNSEAPFRNLARVVEDAYLAGHSRRSHGLSDACTETQRLLQRTHGGGEARELHQVKNSEGWSYSYRPSRVAHIIIERRSVPL